MLFWHFLKAVVTMETGQQGGWKEEHTHGGWGPRVGICPGTQTETSDVVTPQTVLQPPGRGLGAWGRGLGGQLTQLDEQDPGG